MKDKITISKEEYEFLKECEHIVEDLKEDETLSEEEIKFIEFAKRSRRLSKEEFLDKFNKLQNA